MESLANKTLHFGAPLIPAPVTALAGVIGVIALMGLGAWPLMYFLGHSFLDPGFFKALFDPVILSIVQVTAGQAVVSAGLAGLLGMLVGLIIAAHTSPRIDRWIDLLLAIPFAVPTVIAANAWILVLGQKSVLPWAYSLKGLILAHVFYNVPWVALWVAQSARQIPLERFYAARSLGAGRFKAQWEVAWPAIRWDFAAAVTQVFAFCVMSFALVLLIGGGPPVESLETAIYTRVRFGELDLTGAAACAFWELLLCLTPWVLVVLTRGSQTQASEKSARRDTSLAPASPARSYLVVVLAAIWIFPYLWPVGQGLVAMLGLNRIPLGLVSAIGVSIKIAMATATFSVLLAAVVLVFVQGLRWSHPRWARTLETLAQLPSGISVLVMGLAFYTAYSNWIDPFEGSLVAIIAIQVLIFYPVAFKVFWGVAQQSNRQQFEAARSLGASFWQAVWSVEWPRWKKPFLVMAATVAGASMGEVAAVSFFYNEDLVPLPLLISRLMGQYQFEQAAVVSAVLFVLSIGLMMGLSKFTQEPA